MPYAARDCCPLNRKQSTAQRVIVRELQLKHAARTVAQRGRLVLMSEINGKILSLFLAGRRALKDVYSQRTITTLAPLTSC